MIILYRKNVNGVGYWKIWSKDNVIFIVHATIIGALEITHTETVFKGLAGRSLDEQINSRINSRVSRMRDKGYKDTVEQAQTSSTNQLNLLRPMLAQSVGSGSSINFKDSVIQAKLDGHRCLITKQDGKTIAYSRQGKEIDAISHITGPLLDKIPEGTTLDGELYVHGVPLQTLASWIKRKQPDTSRLNYVCYDLVSNDTYIDRHDELNDILSGINTGVEGQIQVLPYKKFVSMDDAFLELDKVRSQGFEGLMLRLANRKYESGKRSSCLLKIKKFYDGEYECIDIESSREGWGIVVLRTSDNQIFRTSAPGSIPEKINQLKYKDKYIGKKLTVEYSQLTNDGIPFHCSALRWREDI